MGKEEKSKPISRLKAIYPLRAKVDESYTKSVEAMMVGEPTVWGMLNFYFGDPILKALDLRTVYPENYSAAIASSGMAPRFLEAADADGFPNHLCGYSRANVGYTSIMMKERKGEIPPGVPMGGMPKPLFLMASAAVCDARYKWFQSLGRYMDVPVWTFEAPLPGVKELFIGDAYEQAVRLGTKNLREFINFVERISGRKMDWDKLNETVDLMIELNRVWHETNLLRKAKPCPMHSRDFWSAMPASLFLLGDLKDTLQCFLNLRNEVQGRSNNQTGAVTEEKYRLVFAELAPWHSLDFFNKLAERGWNFVIESYAYHPPVPLDLSGISDPLERISRFNLQFLVGYYKTACKENVPVGQFAIPYYEYAKEWKCDGAFLHSLISCRSASTHLPYVADMLMEKLKVPSLMIEGDIVDLRLFNPEEALVKAELFEEMMDHYRAVRRKEGLDW
jgi:benzoyl-CoA reductase/2-hydroxyglutaryl-CoA dehydratase subunit BcrC/BadD/HgdB